MEVLVEAPSAEAMTPAGWSERVLQDVAQLINGRGFKPFEWDTSGLPIIRIQNLNGSPDFNYYSGRFDPKIEVEPEQLLFAWSGSRGTSFGPHIWNGPKGVLNYHTWKVRVKEDEICPEFFFHVLRHLTKIIEEQAHGASALVHVQKWEMEKFPFHCPDDRKEQQAIGEALSDADGLIEGLERLIAKKRLIKQGAMQDLLTAKRRLPGFSGEWVVEPIGNFCRSYSGGTPATTNASYYNGSIPWITSSDLNQPEIKSVPSTISTEGLEKSSAKIVPSETVLIALYGATAGVTSFSMISAAINQAVLALLPNESCDPRFLFHSLRNSKSRMISTLTQGGQPNLSGALVKGYELSRPSQPDEQSAIATALDDMDAEIQALEIRLVKARQVKEGMMQNLLTGRIRLV